MRRALASAFLCACTSQTPSVAHDAAVMETSCHAEQNGVEWNASESVAQMPELHPLLALEREYQLRQVIKGVGVGGMVGPNGDAYIGSMRIIGTRWDMCFTINNKTNCSSGNLSISDGGFIDGIDTDCGDTKPYMVGSYELIEPTNPVLVVGDKTHMHFK